MYRTIDAKFWHDPKIRKLSPDGKLLMLYLVTNPHTHLSGLYYVPFAAVTHETGLRKSTLDTLCHTLSRHKLAWFDMENEVIFVVNMFGYQGRGKKNAASAAKQLQLFSESPLAAKFIERYPQFSNTLSIGYQKLAAVGTPEQEQEQEQEQPPTPFAIEPPSVADCDQTDAWSSLSSELLSEGMDFAVAACEKAQHNGNLPHEVRMLLEHWRQHKGAWPVGVLYNKICCLRPDRKTNWPEVPADIKRQQASVVAQKNIATTMGKLKTDRQESGKRKQQEAAELERLESLYSSELDGMAKTRLRAWVEEKYPALAGQVPERGPVKGLLRQQLLAELEVVAKRPALVC